MRFGPGSSDGSRFSDEIDSLYDGRYDDEQEQEEEEEEEE